MSQLRISFGGFSHKGPKFENQDAFAAWHGEGQQLHNKGVVAAIADGVSACSKAKEAANTCVTNFILDYQQTPASWTVKHSASRILESLNRWCHGQVDYSHGGHSQMITTFSGIICKSTSAFLFHCGDSRIYRLQQQQFEQLTQDHSLRRGQGSMLTRAIGIDSRLEVDFQLQALLPGDLFVLTTDGVHEFIPTKELRSLLEQSDDLEACAKQIVTRAQANGSDDNQSCLLVRVDELPMADLHERYQQLVRLAMPPILEPGMKLEGKRVISMLFNGTRSSLYKVVDEASGKVYGLKTPSAYFADDPVYLSGFLREEWIGQTLNSPHIMQILPRPADAKFMYHVCEYIDGITLRQWITENPHPSLDQVRQILTQLISALRTLQRNQMVHRDVKPENVMITPHGEVKLIDFGTVLVAAQRETGDQIEESVPQGSVNYIAPEYLLAQQSDFRADLFSAAVLTYEMLTGKLPFTTFAYKDYIPASYSEWQYQPLQQLRPDLPPWLDVCLKKALQPNPAWRYQAFSEFLTELATPSAALLRAEQKRPLAERNPVLLWQLISAFLLAIIVLQALL